MSKGLTEDPSERWEDSLGDLERRALLLAHAYQKIRRKHQQFGYRVFKEEGPELVKTPQFKQFLTVTKWLMSNGWRVTWSEFHWQGYVEFTFRWMDPTIPMPGQLRNKRLLGEYIKSQPQNVEARAPARYSWKELEALYAKKMRPEIRNRGALLAALNLRQFQSDSK